MRLLAVRVLAVFFALTWLVFPGFGLIDLRSPGIPDWPVVLEASWGVFMTRAGRRLVPRRRRPARPGGARDGRRCCVALATWLVAAAAGLEWPLLGLRRAAGRGGCAARCSSLPGRERLRPRRLVGVGARCSAVAALGVVPWLLHAERMFAANRRNAGVLIGDVTMGVDHYAVQGALALALAGARRRWPRAGPADGGTSASPSGSAPATSGSCPSRSRAPGPGSARSGRSLCMAWGGGGRRPGARRAPVYSRASSAARSSRPSEPCDSAAMCQALRSKASPRACRAASRPSSQARSPSL